MNRASAKDSNCSQTVALSFPTKWAKLGLLLCQRKQPFLDKSTQEPWQRQGLKTFRKTEQGAPDLFLGGTGNCGQCRLSVPQWCLQTGEPELLIADNVRRVHRSGHSKGSRVHHDCRALLLVWGSGFCTQSLLTPDSCALNYSGLNLSSQPVFSESSPPTPVCPGNV